MKKIKLDYLTLLALLVVFAFVLVKECFAAQEAHSSFIAPEPASLIVLSTTGLLGFITRLARKSFKTFKRLFDVVASLIGLVVLSPLMLLAVVLIKTCSPGSALFRQERVGENGKAFNLYKFRSMSLDAEKDSGPVWAKSHDSRLIKCGHFLRSTHIDELPQLINVLRGEMSIVGPRPERPVFVDKLSKEINDYKKRLRVKPGMTGIAQVWHKYDETVNDVKKKIKYDLLYIRKMCFLVDLSILVRTLRVVALRQK